MSASECAHEWEQVWIEREQLVGPERCRKCRAVKAAPTPLGEAPRLRQLIEALKEIQWLATGYKSAIFREIALIAERAVDESVAEGAACQGVPEDDWQPIETAPQREDVLFWIVPKTADEAYTDSLGYPITSLCVPYLYHGKFNTWSALSKATHWHRLPTAPLVRLDD